MPEQNEFYDLLFAYSLGCLDEEDFLKLKEYLKSNEEYWQELGEYQNLVSLLPSILNIETPNPEVKDNVARKLYKLKGEVPKKKNVKEKLQVETAELNKEKEDSENTINAVEETFSEKLNTRTDGFEVVTAKKKVEYFRPTQETQIRGRDFENISDDEDEKENVTHEEQETQASELAKDGKSQAEAEKKKTYTLHGDYGSDKKSVKEGKTFLRNILLIILLTAAAAGILFFYFKVSSEVRAYKSKVESLNEQVKDLSSTTAVSRELSELLQSKNLKIINLDGTDINHSGFGKLIISLENSRGFLQLSQMPGLSTGKVYQLWLSMNKKFVSMGTFSPVHNDEYFPVTLPEITNQQSAKFMVSEEPLTGSLEPGNKIFLTGSF